MQNMLTSNTGSSLSYLPFFITEIITIHKDNKYTHSILFKLVIDLIFDYQINIGVHRLGQRFSNVKICCVLTHDNINCVTLYIYIIRLSDLLTHCCDVVNIIYYICSFKAAVLAIYVYTECHGQF
jgi:hypothetical protein